MDSGERPCRASDGGGGTIRADPGWDLSAMLRDWIGHCRVNERVFGVGSEERCVERKDGLFGADGHVGGELAEGFGGLAEVLERVGETSCNRRTSSREGSMPITPGYVSFPASMSLPAFLPRCSVDWVTSRRSSTIWNMSPMASA